MEKREIKVKPMLRKTSEECRKHFTERLLERYEMKITKHQYQELYNQRRHTLFNKNQKKILCTISIKDITVPVLFDRELEVYLTAYPQDVLTNETSFLKACFGSRIHPIIFMIQDFIHKRINEEWKDFDNEKEAALYFFQNCTFPTLMISVYKKGKYALPQIARIINNIIEAKEHNCELTIRSFSLLERQERLQDKINWREENGLSKFKTRQMRGKMRTLTYPVEQ